MTTPDEARGIAEYLRHRSFRNIAAEIESLADQLEQVTRERDEALSRLEKSYNQREADLASGMDAANADAALLAQVEADLAAVTRERDDAIAMLGPLASNFLAQHQPAEQKQSHPVSEPDGFGGYNTWGKGTVIEIPPNETPAEQKIEP